MINSGTFAAYHGGNFNMTAYGERLAINKVGYHHEDFDFATGSLSISE